MSANQTNGGLPRAKVVLFAEDDLVDGILIKRAVSKWNCQLDMRIVKDGADAIAWLAGQGRYADRNLFPMPDVLVTDLKMPKCGGMDVLQWVRAQAKFNKLPIIVHTGSDAPQDIAACKKLGATKFVTKTPTIDPLIHILACLLDCKNANVPCYPACASSQIYAR